MTRADRIAAYRKAATLHRMAADAFELAAGFAAADNASEELEHHLEGLHCAGAAADAHVEHEDSGADRRH